MALRSQLSGNGSYFLDFVRVLATNLVLIGHTSTLFQFERPIETGGLGVVLFFLLSGFLITIAGLRRWDREGPQFGSFMIDRCARIFLPFLPALICVALLNSLLSLENYGQPGINTGIIALLANATLLNDYPAQQAASHFVNVDPFFVRAYNTAEPFWTIPLEFWTYVVFAVFLFGLLRREKIRLALLIPLLSISLPVFLWNSFAGGGDCLCLAWVLGAAVGWVWCMQPINSLVLPVLGWVMLAFGLIGLAGRSLRPGFDAHEFQQVAFITCILFACFLLAESSKKTSQRLGKLLTVLASYSYSLYLVHNTVLVLFREKLSGVMGEITPFAAMLATHVVAYLFYLAFERHYHKFGTFLKKRLRVGLSQ